MPAEVVARRVDDDIVLVHLGTDQVFSLNDTAARCWELLSEGSSPEAVVVQIEREYDVDAATVRAELSGLLDELVARGLVQPDGDG